MSQIKIALAGNPNCGKTTLFNNLTGSNQYVGNWPGVTVEKKEGRLKSDKEVIIQDLPGIYSLSPYTLEEVVTRNYLVDEQPDAILDIVDATNIERNLYLTTQLIELGIPVIIGLNMMDLVKKSGDKIDIEEIKKELGCEIVPISALRGEGIDEVSKKAVDIAKNNAFSELPHVFVGSVEHAIAHIEDCIRGKIKDEYLRWFSVKVFERDEKIIEKLNLDESTLKVIEKSIKDCENELEDDSESIITNQRYEYIQKIVKKYVVKKNKNKLPLSDRVDMVLTNRILALPIFVLVMYCVYYLSIVTIGKQATDWTNDVLVGDIIQKHVGDFLSSIHASDVVKSLVVDGIIHGLGAPLGFVPQMAVVFLLLGILEDCGYMARIAFIMDRIFRRFGLSGKSFIPFMISSGCGVPGILATRTIESEKDRRMTMIVTTDVPCGAKLPVIALIGAYIAGEWWIAPTMYFFSIILIIVTCIILKKTRYFAGDPVPFVMELPAYHLPTFKGLLLHVWERVWAFAKKAGTVLFLCCTVMWFLASFGIEKGSFGLVDSVEHSLLANVGMALAIMFRPIGFTWQTAASSISGFAAKEGLVTTMGVLAGLKESDEYTGKQLAHFESFFPTTVTALSYLAFNLFDSPCIAAMSTLAKEIGKKKYFWIALLLQNVIAYGLSLIIYQIGGVFITREIKFNPATVVALVLAAAVIYLLFRKDPNKKKSKVVSEEKKAA